MYDNWVGINILPADHLSSQTIVSEFTRYTTLLTLFQTEESLVGWLVCFYSLSTLPEYLVLNLVHTHARARVNIYIYIYICVCVCVCDLLTNNLQVTFLNKPKLICLHIVELFYALFFIVCTQLNGFQYC